MSRRGGMEEIDVMTQRVQADLDVDLDDPVHGVLTGSDGEPHRFEGWLEFHAALNALPPRIGDVDRSGNYPPEESQP